MSPSENSERNGQICDPSTQDSAGLSPVKRALREVRELRAQLTEARETASSRQYGPVAIVGVGLRFPGGIIDATSFWDLLANGKDAITDIPQDRWDYRQYFDSDADTRGAMYSIRGGFLEGIDLFDADFFGIAPREAVMLDPQQRLLHEVAWHALEDAAIRPDRLRSSRTGIFLGMSNFDYCRVALEDDLRIDAYTGSGNSPSMAAGRLAYTLGVHGPAVTVDTSCSSSLMAVHLASQSLRARECDLALAGGVNLILAPQMHIGFSRAHMLAPDGRCKTFDESADGYVRSEGCAVVILKRLQEAVKDGDRILAVVRGSATNHDGRSGGLTAPSSQAQTALIREAFNNAGVTVNDVGMIEAHGTGTSLGDPIEMEALGEVFRHRAANLSPVTVGSVKTNLGHAESASGMAGLLKAALCLDRKQIPRHLHLNRKSGFISWEQLPFRIPTEHTKWELEVTQRRRIAGISSFGFSGTNAHVVLEEFVPEDRIPSASAISGPHVAVVSGQTGEALAAAQGALLHHLQNDDGSTLTDLCQTLSRGRMQHAHRRAFVVNARGEFEERLRLEISQPGNATSTKGFEHSLCFLFTGQGSEHSGMGLELYERSRIFRSTVDQLDHALQGTADKSIRQIWANEAGELERASLLQPALYAYGWSLSELWRSWGVAPRVVLGHSLGEYIAATVAGVMTPQQAIRLVAARGRLLEELAEPGGMIAVVASKQLIEDLLLALPFGRELSVAAVNGPASIVVSGPIDAVAQFEEHLIHRQMRHRRLRTTHGFHSAALDRMLDAFEGEAARVEYKVPEVPWISNVTGKPVQREQPVDSGYWRQHLRYGVEFAEGLKAAADVASVFVELGAKPQLLALAEANEIDRDRLIPSISKGANGGEWQKILTAASRLYTLGVDLDWDAVADHGAYRKLALPGYPFQRSHYWCNEAADVNENACVRMAEAANDQAVMVPIQLDVVGLAERQNALNRWATAHIFATLLELGCFGRDGDTLTAFDLIEKHRVVPVHRRLMERWLLRLAQEGILQATDTENTAFAPVFGVIASDPALLWIDVERLLPGDEPLRNYLAECSAGLLRVLRGELNPLETLFPRGDGELAKALYERSPGAVYVNRIASAAVAARTRISTRTALGFPRRLRILEVGAGTGSTTAAIIAQLAPESVDYNFSDVSKIFLTRARQRFRNFPITFTLFDLDCAEHASRHEGRYDVVVIANALHAAKDLRTSLKHVRQVLQPGGSVVLVETTAAQAWHDVSTGLMEGWQHHSDEVRVDRSPLLSVDCWAKEFSQGGWDHFAAVPGQEHATHQLGLHVLVAQKPVEALPSDNVTESSFVGRISMASAFFREENLHAASAGNDADIVTSPSTTLVEEIAAALPRQRVKLVTEATTSSVAQVLGRSAWPMKEDRLMDIGLDSLMAIELRNRLQTIFRLDQLSSTLIFDYPTSEAIARLLLGRLGYQEDGRPVGHMPSEPEATFSNVTKSHRSSCYDYIQVNNELHAAVSADTPLDLGEDARSGRGSFGKGEYPAMTTTLELFSHLRAKGVNIAIDGDALKLTAPKGVMTAELRQEIASRKPEIVALLHSLLQTARTSESSMDRFERTSTMPLSFSQQRLWFLHQLDGADPAYNIPAVLRLSGALDISALEGGIAEIIARHENLRTRFIQEEGSPRAVIDENSAWHLERVDLQDLPEAERDSVGLRRAIEFTKQPFDLSIGPLMRSSLITLNRETHFLSLSMHHIISDGWSLGVLVRELTDLYSAAKKGIAPSLAPLAVQYADFAQWQRKWLESGELERQLPYWKACLAGAPPIVEFPLDFRRPRSESSCGHRSRVSFPPSLSAALEQLSRDQDVTLFMLLLAAFKTLLYRYTGQEDLVVGSPSANRNRSELHPIIGFFVNNLVLRTNLAGNPTFLELLARVREVTLRAYDHQDVPFEKLVQALRPERAIDHSPLFQTMFSFQNFPIDDLELPGLIITPVEMDCGTSRFDLTVEIYPRHGEMHAFFEYKTDIYHHETIVALQRHFLSVLQSVVADPAQHILSIPLMVAEEKLDLVVARNQTSSPYPADSSFHRRFEQNAREHPDHIAVTAAGSALTYAQLNLRANQIADLLIRSGAGPGKVIGICVDRSTDLLAGLLGILKSGAAYVPLDPTYPRQRIAGIFEDAEPVALVTTKARQGLLSDSTATIICLDALPSPQPDEYADPGISISPNDLAYVIFTSGSTGKPKGVQIPHVGLMNFLESMRHTPGLTSEDVLLAVTTVSFDIAALELYLPLYVGGRVHISVRPSDATALLEELTVVRPSVMQATPATWRLLLSAGWTGDDRLKILCGGESLEIELARTLLPRCASLWNMYGPTETTIWSAAMRVTDANDQDIPIGPPIANTSFYILDSARQLVPIGVAGELYIGGHGVARGYLGRPDLTEERFIPDPFQPQTNARLYRTGDLVRYRCTGEIEFLGRIDHQVKLRGFRIELGEIEHCLRAQSGIKDAVVVLRQDFGDKRIVGYVLADDIGKPPAQATLRDALRQALPDYMIPAAIVVLDRFPCTPNGKLDRTALPPPDQATSVAAFVAPGTEEQRAVAGVFKGLLHLEKVSIQDNFFDIGAHSLLIAQAQDKLKRTLDPDLQIIDFFRYPTIESLAAFLRNRKPQDLVADAQGNRTQRVVPTYA